jgi:hypothetical protein
MKKLPQPSAYLFLLSTFCLLLAACAPKIDPSLTSAVKGQTLIGPTCPVMRIDNPCPDEPYQAKLTVLSPDGQVVTRAASDAEGKFEIKLPAGEYILHAENPEGQALPYADDTEFTVVADKFTEIEIHFDSGIR